MPLAAAAAGAAATAVLSRRQLSQLPALTPSVAASSGSAVLQAVDVTLLLTTTSASQALPCTSCTSPLRNRASEHIGRAVCALPADADCAGAATQLGVFVLCLD